MIDLEAARARVLEGCAPLAPERVPLAGAVGLVLAEPVVADQFLPPFANTAVDGYAVRAADVAAARRDAPARLAVLETIAAGRAADRPVGPGEAMRIMTGAPVPDGADAVVMVEETDGAGDGELVAVYAPVSVGDAVRPAGDDVKPGDRLFAPGDVLSPAHIGVLASLGWTAVLAHPRPRVGVISTGDELIEGPQALQPGQIRDSNRITLLALVEAAGAVGVDLGLVRDDEELIRAAFTGAADGCDAIISSGGVSMGEFDYVKRVLDEVGRMNWMQVAIRPAKPLAFGTIGGTPVFGLPGNPVSSMVSFELFARPGLRRLAGHPDERLVRRPVRATTVDPLRRTPDGKTHFARVVADNVDGRIVVRNAGGQGSHQLAVMAAANALVVLPDGEGVDAGEEVAVLLLA
ncbi:MAG: molybdopterin molybdotransferase MoeA [Acidimicrobiales bacterium]